MHEPPHNIELEQAVLGALLHDNNLFEKVDFLLKATYFYHPVHAKIYEVMEGLFQKGSIASPLTLAPFFKEDNGLKELGGATYFTTLGEHILSFASLGDYAKQIHDFYLRRQLIQIGQNLIEESAHITLKKNALHHIEKTEERLFHLASQGVENKGFLAFNEALAESIQTAETAFKSESHVVGVTTGLKDMDKQLGGLHPSDLIIIAGRPSMGKTGLAAGIGFNAAKAYLNSQGATGAACAFFSLEMSAEQIATRLLSQESGISSDKIRRGAISQDDFPKFLEVSRTLSALPLYIDDTPALSVASIRTRARRLMRQKGLGLIVIDYLQLLSSDHSENRVQELSHITRQLKALAKELHIPVIAASQLSRLVEQREDKRPMLSDLRESGSIEQDADVVMFIYREAYYVGRQKPPEESDKMATWQEKMNHIHNIAEVMVAKQRHGPIGQITLHFNGMLTKFSDKAPSYIHTH